MKKNSLWMLACALIFSLVTFSACSSDDDNENPVTEPVFLSKIDMVTFTPLTGDTDIDCTKNQSNGRNDIHLTAILGKEPTQIAACPRPVLLLRLLYLS